MSMRLRLFFAFALMIGLSSFLMLKSVIEELKPAMRQAVEETLIDTSIMLAETAREDFKAGSLKKGHLANALRRYAKASPDADVWGILKQQTDHRVYVTDAKGIVIFDSNGGKAVGEDYSKWNDVYLTLRGKYGARSTPTEKENETVMYVAAPIIGDKDTLYGVLSVGKPTGSLEPYFDKTKDRIIEAGLVLFVAALIVALILAWWHGRDVTRLAAYADATAKGKSPDLPSINTKELKRLGQSVEHMRIELEGKEYVENYVHTLTHELKSPLTAIGGAVEILNSPNLSDEDRHRFMKNIGNENERMRQIIEQLLDLAALEKRKSLIDLAPIDLSGHIHSILQAKESQIRESKLTIQDNLPDQLPMEGEPFLIRQALDNILSNGLNFTPSGGVITIGGHLENGICEVIIHNSGPSIPDYAQQRLFERFYSLPRPGSETKGTGLGLPFAREVAELHGGDIQLENDPIGGVRAIIHLAEKQS